MLVAFIGIILRYKIAYSLPFIDQRYLLHGHSHFAFAGWVTQALMALLVACLSEQAGKNLFKKYRWLLYSNLLTAYGMLVTFPIEGYAFLSILFSTLSIFVSYFFAAIYWVDLNKLDNKNTSHHCFRIALLCNVISSAGPFSLAYMLATKHMQQNLYLASVYFFLHFQYNGWFFFSCLGLLIYRLNKYKVPGTTLKKVFYLFAISVLPAFFLSVLWWDIPTWLYILVVAATICQIAGWIQLLNFIQIHVINTIKQASLLSKFLFISCGIALSIKLILQAGSVIPSLSKLAFGFRPIVIGYLHLVLLGVITIFIISYSFTYKLISINKRLIAGITIFVIGIFVNEILLMIQGISAMIYESVPFINESLLFAAVLLTAGMLVINYSQNFYKDDQNHKTINAID